MRIIDLENAREVLRQFDVSSAIDVLLIAVVIYTALRLVSGTRAMTQLRGAILLVLVAVLAARIFDLRVVRFLVENSITALVIVAAIIFQPELRRMLDRLGRTGIQGLIGRTEYRGTLEGIARAAARLSNQRIGALIVVERQTGLQDIIETGVRVDALVSPELLTTIFFPKTALHDMAVVIRQRRIVAASCVLPLASDFSDVDQSHGTRHRAAVGVTEFTDAVAIVVSEETGRISVAVAGRLIGVADDRRLLAVLEWLFNQAPTPERATPEGSGQVAVS
jgi:diadenylate cyclase